MFWFAAVLSNTGSSMQMVTIPYVIFALTNSTRWLGVSAAIAFVPNVIVGPLGGSLADRHSRRTVLLVCQTVSMASALILWVLWVTGHATVWSILGTMLVGSVAGGINISSWQAFVPSLVPREDLLNAVRLNSIQFTVARAGGPVLAGLVLTQVGAGAAFLANAISFAPVIAVLLILPDPPPVGASSGHSIPRAFLEGVGYIRRHPSMVQCVLNILVLAAFAYAFIQLAPAVAKNQLHVGKAGYGYLVSAYGVGSVLSSFLVAARGDRLPRSRAALSGFALAATGTLLLGAATSLWLGVVAFFCIGVAQTVAAVAYNTTIQIQVDDAFRGRVLSVYLMAIQLGLPVGALLLGSVAAVTGTSTMALLAGLLLVGYLVLVVTGFGRLRALDRNEQLAPEPAVIEVVTPPGFQT